jgi:cytochrome c-type biogenesis protein CcmE
MDRRSVPTMKNKSRIKLAVTILIAVVGIGYVASQSLADVTYYKLVAEVTKDPEPWLQKQQMKIHGYVSPGTIETNVVDQRTHRTFVLHQGKEEIIVRHTGPVADTFKDQAETVVTGKLTRENGKLVMNAVDGDAGISAKCPSKYEGDKKP